MGTDRDASVVALLAGAVAVGAVIGVGSFAGSPQGRAALVSQAGNVSISLGLKRQREPQAGDQWGGCNDARLAGTSPIYQGEPGYREDMDGDGDGIACEPAR
ncbi:MAG: excalibur calcium-binding domain-containing protein [Sphingomonas sp.]|nr:excalibur calcium-binding domain-containing protein [Sphingomonas sp.]